MNKTDEQRLGLLVGVLAEGFRQTISPATIEAYRIGLRDLTIGAVQVAVDRALRECRFMPSVAELRELTGQLRPEQRASVAWSVLSREVRDGGYTTVVFDDPILTATVRALGGWEPVCVLFDEEPMDWLEGVFRKRFTATYTALAAHGISEHDAFPLPGSHETQNRFHGYLDRVHEPKRIECGLPTVPVKPVALPSGRPRQALLENIGAEPR